MVLGEAAIVLEEQGRMLRVRTALDSYEGWLHQGYTHAVTTEAMDHWLAEAAWSEWATLEDDAGVAMLVPHRSRLIANGFHAILPTGMPAEVLNGSIRPLPDIIAEARQESPADWAWEEFAGAPYLWGGITSSGIDCSGLVQTTFLLRGIQLPRDTHQQVMVGMPVDLGEQRAGDLLFFRSAESEKISHVAILAGHETIVHSTIDAGRVIRESWHEGIAVTLHDRLVAVRRHE